MAFDSSKASNTRFSIHDKGKNAHNAIILKRAMLDGKIKVYTDEKGGAEKTEILIPEGKLVIYKDYEEVRELAKYKKIDIYSKQDELIDSLTIIQEGQVTLHPTYRFYYGNAPIGRASGEFVMYLAQKLLGEAFMDPRYVTGAQVDEDIIDTLYRILHRKRF